jgi:hypothetical protein
MLLGDLIFIVIDTDRQHHESLHEFQFQGIQPPLAIAWSHITMSSRTTSVVSFLLVSVNHFFLRRQLKVSALPSEIC